MNGVEFSKFEPVYGPMEYVDGHWQKTFIEKRILDRRLKDGGLGIARDFVREDIAKELLCYLNNGAEYDITIKETFRNVDWAQQEYTFAVRIVLKKE